MGRVHEMARKASENSTWKPPNEREGGRAPEKTPVRKIGAGSERRQVNFKLPVALMEELEQAAKKRGTTMTMIVEEALAEKLQAVCESCGR